MSLSTLAMEVPEGNDDVSSENKVMLFKDDDATLKTADETTDEHMFYIPDNDDDDSWGKHPEDTNASSQGSFLPPAVLEAEEGSGDASPLTIDDDDEASTHQSPQHSHHNNENHHESTTPSTSTSDQEEQQVSSVTMKRCISTNILIEEPKPILKRVYSDPAFINEKKRRAWKVLPKLSKSSSACSSSSSLAQTPPPPDENTHTNTNTLRRNRSVTFDKVQIREYDQCCGDNPSVSYGPPIQLDWNYQEFEALELDAYEYHRLPQRRKPSQMMMNYYQRQNTLSFYYGVSDQELARAKQQVKREQSKRNITRNYLVPLMKVEDAIESMVRKSKRVFSKENLAEPEHKK